jgi:signal transduction histidine kinase
MHASEVFVPEDQSRVDQAITETLDTGSTTNEFGLLTSNGVERPYEFRTKRLTDNEGRMIGLVGIGRDVSERKRQERQVEQFESFGSVLSHDLRSPLDTLEGRLELARDTHEDEHFEAAEQAVERLNTLVEELSNAMKEG